MIAGTKKAITGGAIVLFISSITGIKSKDANTA